jgi:hypothetical protein
MMDVLECGTTPDHLTIMPKTRPKRCCESKERTGWFGIQSAWLLPGEADIRNAKASTMLETALLIASALSLTMVVLFSELP